MLCLPRLLYGVVPGWGNCQLACGPLAYRGQYKKSDGKRGCGISTRPTDILAPTVAVTHHLCEWGDRRTVHLDGFWASRGDEAAVPDVFPVPYPSLKGFPGDSVIKKPPANAGDAGDMGLIPGLGRPPPRRRKWQPTPVFLPGKSHGQRSLVGYSPWGHKKSDVTEHMHTCTHTFFSKAK